MCLPRILVLTIKTLKFGLLASMVKSTSSPYHHVPLVSTLCLALLLREYLIPTTRLLKQTVMKYYQVWQEIHLPALIPPTLLLHMNWCKRNLTNLQTLYQQLPKMDLAKQPYLQIQEKKKGTSYLANTIDKVSKLKPTSHILTMKAILNPKI